MQTQKPLQWNKQGPLVDVREPFEFASLHAEGAHNLPLGEISVEQLNAQFGESATLGILCQSGARAKQAAHKCEGYAGELFVIEGGTDAWHQARLPVIEGKKVMSLERQVRIAAGALVVLGVVLNLMGWHGFIYVSLFVGCGLVFAGVTDTCGMGLMLAKMPWNRCPKEQCRMP
jgi:rhodanese-related sulfurtransferase